MNLYTYCHNDPVNYVDPSGHFAIGALVAGGLAAGAMKLASGISRTISSSSGTKTSSSGGSSGTRRSSSSSSNSSNKNTSSSSNTSSTSNKTSNLAEVYEAYIESGSNRTSSNNGSVLLSIGSAVNNMYQSVNNTLSSVVNRVSTNSSIGNYNTSAQRIIKPFQLLGSSNILENIGELYLEINHRIIEDKKVVDGTILAPLTEVIGGLGGTVKPSENGYVVNVNGQVINYDLDQITDGIGLASDYSAFYIYNQTIYVGVAETDNKLGANIRYEKRDGKISGLIVTPKDRIRWVDNDAIVVEGTSEVGNMTIRQKGFETIADFEMSSEVLKSWGLGEYDTNGNLTGIYPHYVFKNVGTSKNPVWKSDGGITFGYGHYVSAGEYKSVSSEKALVDKYANGAPLLPSVVPSDGVAYRVPNSTAMPITEVMTIFEADLDGSVDAVNEFLLTNNISVEQHQFDMLVSYTHNYGDGVWSLTGDKEKYLVKYFRESGNNFTDEGVMDAFSGSSNKSRRIQEANIFINGY